MTDNKLTDKEIIKALECCRDIDIKCETCQLWTVSECTKVLHQATLDLINRQQAENKELKTENLILSQKRFNIFERIEFTDKLKKQIKSEAIKEFADSVIKNICEQVNAPTPSESYVVEKCNQVIDNLVKEMVGEQG